MASPLEDRIKFYQQARIKQERHAALIAKLETIEDQAEDLLEDYSYLDTTKSVFTISTFGIMPDLTLTQRQSLDKQSEALCTTYNSSLEDIGSQLGVAPQAVSLDMDKPAALRMLMIECTRVLAAFNAPAFSLSKRGVEKLNHMREEAEGACKGLKADVRRNLELAIGEAEASHFLASSLIAGRLIDWTFDQIPGDGMDQKIELLVRSGAIEAKRKDLKAAILKASKRTRNLSSHDISVFPLYSETVSLLGDCLQVLKLYAIQIGEAGGPSK